MEKKKNKVKPNLDLTAFLDQSASKGLEEDKKGSSEKNKDDALQSPAEKKTPADQSNVAGGEKRKNVSQQARDYEKEVLNKKGENHYDNFENFFIGETSNEKRSTVFIPESLHDTLKTISINCSSSTLEVLVKNIVLNFLTKNKEEIKTRMEKKRNEILRNV